MACCPKTIDGILSDGSSTFIQEPLNAEFINNITDLPTAVAGIRQLEANKCYNFTVSITDGNQWALPNNASICLKSDVYGITLTYTGTSKFIITRVGERVEHLTITGLIILGTGANIAGTGLIDIVGLGAGDFLLNPYSRVRIISCFFGLSETIIKLTEVSIIIYNLDSFDAVDHFILDDGYGGITGSVFSSSPFSVHAGGNIITLIVGIFIAPTLTVSHTAFFARAGDFAFNIPIGYPGQVISNGSVNIGQSGSFNPAGLDQTSDKIRFSGGLGFPISLDAADVYLNAPNPNEQIVPIITAGIYEDVTNTTGIDWLANIIERFALNVNGQVTFMSTTSATFQIQVNATLEKVGGGTDLLSLAIGINGVYDATGSGNIQNTNPAQANSMTTVLLVNNDIITLGVANLSSTSNVLVSKAKVLISALTG